MKNHNFIQVARAQRVQDTLYCAGLDIHSFGGSGNLGADFAANMRVYGFQNGGEIDTKSDTFGFYERLVGMTTRIELDDSQRVAGLLAAIEDYTRYVVQILSEKCGIRVYKPQFGLYIQFGGLGAFLLEHIHNCILEQEGGKDQPHMVILDCKPGDIATTQAGYFLGYAGNLNMTWGVNYEPFGFDIINPAPWMGEDVMVLEDKDEKPLIGLELLRRGKGLIYVNQTSNPSGPQYQGLEASGDTLAHERLRELGIKPTLGMLNAADAYLLSQKHDLEDGGLSQLGLVIGATYPCDGSIRRAFPLYTGLNPGFGAQSVGKKITPYQKVILELISDGPWKGQGGIWSSSRGTMFPWISKYGGSGKVENLEADLIAAINRHREEEEAAFNNPKVIEAGIEYPFRKVA